MGLPSRFRDTRRPEHRIRRSQRTADHERGAEQGALERRAGAIRPLNRFGRASGARFGTDRVANVLPLCRLDHTRQARPGTPAADPGPVGCTPSPRRLGENQ
jgi:hypothetical protein